MAKFGFTQPSDAALAVHLYEIGLISLEEMLEEMQKRVNPEAKKVRKHELGPNHHKRFWSKHR